MSLTSPVEITAVGFSLLSVWLTVRKNVWCWPVGLIGVVAYADVFLRLRLYSDLSLQAVFFAQGLYGWWFWIRGGEAATEPPVGRLGWRKLAVVVLLLLAGAAGVGDLLQAHTDAAAPHLDAFLALTSLTANQMLARKLLESWWLWILADALYVGLFLVKGVPFSAGLYAVFLAMAVQGAMQWQKGFRTTATAVEA